jgi:hypothetical protein
MKSKLASAPRVVTANAPIWHPTKERKVIGYKFLQCEIIKGDAINGIPDRILLKNGKWGNVSRKDTMSFTSFKAASQYLLENF